MPVTIALAGGSGLVAEAGALTLKAEGASTWRIVQAPGNHPWFKLCPLDEGGMCVDLSNPEQLPVLSPDADVSGQYWQATRQNGCKKLKGGAIARCVIGYTLHSMWTGEDRLLTAVGDTVELQDAGIAGQVWEINEEDGRLWMGEPEACIEPVAEPVELIECVGPPDEICIEPMVCGGFMPARDGGPTELLEGLRAEAQAMAAGNGWEEEFSQWEVVSNRTQVVAGTNHFCKVLIGEDTCAHVTVFEPLPGQGPARVSCIDLPKALEDPL